MFVFYTDGLADAAPGAEEYGTARLRGVVETHAALPATGLATGSWMISMRSWGAPSPRTTSRWWW